MLRKIFGILSISALVSGAYYFGTFQASPVVVKVIPDGYIDMESPEFLENYVDMRQVTDWTAEDGLQLYLDNGEGYYLEK